MRIESATVDPAPPATAGTRVPPATPSTAAHPGTGSAPGASDAVPVSQVRPPSRISLRGVSKVYGPGGTGVFALDRLTLEVARGEFVCLVGASGCGKTTLLNIVAGLDEPASGSVEISGRTALLFQEAALLPWLTVEQNIHLALKLRGVRRAERHRRTMDLLGLVQLADFATKRPHELSGGMRQRVALARALAQDADILLMDEPFAAVDAITRDLLHDQLERIWREAGLTVLFVTHNVREAVRLGDRVVLLSSRPGSVVEEFAVDVDRSRRATASVDLTRLTARITDRLRQEVRRHAGTVQI